MEYLNVLIKHKVMIVCATATGFLFALLLALMLPKVYRSTTLILPPEQDQGMMAAMMGQQGGSMAGLAAGLTGSGGSADLFLAILNSNAVADAVIDRFKLMELYGKRYRTDTYRTLARRVDFAVGKKDGIISITVEDQDPGRAAQMADAFVQELDRLTARTGALGASQNREYVEERLAKAKAECARAEEALKSFQSRNKMVALKEQAEAAITGVNLLKTQLAQQQVQLTALQRQFTDQSQEVKNLKASMARLRSQQAAMEAASRGGLPGLGGMPALQLEYQRLMREFKTRESLVELLTAQHEMFKLSEANGASNLQIVQKARVPDRKAKPKRGVIVVLITLTASLAAALGAFGLETWRGLPEARRRRCQQLFRKVVS